MEVFYVELSEHVKPFPKPSFLNMFFHFWVINLSLFLLSPNYSQVWNRDKQHILYLDHIEIDNQIFDAFELSEKNYYRSIPQENMNIA